MNLVDKGEDESESEVGLRRRTRRRTFLLLGGVGAAVAAAVLVAANPWNNDDAADSADVAADSASPPNAADQPAAAEPELSNRLLFAPTPENFAVQYVSDPTSNDQGFGRLGDGSWSLISPMRHGIASATTPHNLASQKLAPGGYTVRIDGEQSSCEADFAVKSGAATLSRPGVGDPRQPRLPGR